MATGDLGQLGKATVSVEADMSPFDKAMSVLPERSAAGARAAMDRIKREMQTNSASIARAVISQKTAGPGNEGRDQFNRASASIDKFREANRDLQSQLDAVVASVQRKAAVVSAMAEKEAAAVAASAARQVASNKVAAQQADVLAGRGAMVGNQFVSFASKANVAQAGLAGIGKMGNQAAYKMQVFGQALDDLQYVPQMGLRPIINNLMQITPLLGIVAIGANTLYTNFDKISGLWQSEETIKEAKRQRELADATEAAAQAYEHEAAAMKGIKGEVTDTMQGTAKAASDKVGTNAAVEELAQLMLANKLYTPRTPPKLEKGNVDNQFNLLKDDIPKETAAQKKQRDMDHIRDQARQLLTNARSGDGNANDRLESLMGTDQARGRFAAAYRMHQFQNPTGNEKLDRDADARAQKWASFMAEEKAKKEKEAADKEKEKARSFSDNASPAARKMVLQAAASGSDLDLKKLSERMAEDMVKAGVDPKEAGGLSEKAAKDLGDTIGKRLTEEASKNGSTKERAARSGLVDLQIEGARRLVENMQANLEDARKEIKEARVMSSSEFAQNLLSARPKSSEEIAQKQLNEAQKAVTRLEQIRDNLTRGIPARIGR